MHPPTHERPSRRSGYARSASGLYVPEDAGEVRLYDRDEAIRRCGTAIGIGVSPSFGRGTATPLSIVGATNTVAWYRSDDLVQSGTVSQWNDKGPNGFHLTQATAGLRPTYNATGGPNGVPSVLFDGVDDLLGNSSLNLPAPGTTPTAYWFVMRQVVATAGDRFMAAGAGDNLIVYTPAANNNFVMFNGLDGPNSGSVLTTNTYGRFELLFSNSANDYLLLKATLDTGPTASNNDPPVGFQLGGRATLEANCEFVELLIANTSLAPFSAALTAYGIGRYGAGVFS